jgi:hypothetical protein
MPSSPTLQAARNQNNRELTAEEQKVVSLATTYRDELVLVDVVDKYGHVENSEGHVRPALAGTARRLAARNTGASTAEATA